MGGTHQANNQSYITLKKASFLSGYTSDYLGRLARAKKFVAIRIGKSWLIQRKDFEVFLRVREYQNKLNKQYPGYLTLAEASLMSGYAQDYLGLLVRKHVLTGVRPSHIWLVKKADLEHYIAEKNETKPAKRITHDDLVEAKRDDDRKKQSNFDELKAKRFFELHIRPFFRIPRSPLADFVREIRANHRTRGRGNWSRLKLPAAD